MCSKQMPSNSRVIFFLSFFPVVVCNEPHFRLPPAKAIEKRKRKNKTGAMLTIAALNAPKAPPAASVLAPGGQGAAAGADGGEETLTLEAAEARCVSSFESALALVQGEPEKAKVSKEA